MPHIVLAFDPSTSIVCFSCQEGVDELPFPVAALLCSLKNYAEQEGWMLEDVRMQDCHQVYHKWVESCTCGTAGGVGFTSSKNIISANCMAGNRCCSATARHFVHAQGCHWPALGDATQQSTPWAG